MSMSPMLQGANGGGGANGVNQLLTLNVELLSLIQTVEHRATMVRVFEAYSTAWNNSDAGSMSDTYYRCMTATEEQIQRCDLRITRIIELDGQYRQQRIDDENIPF